MIKWELLKIEITEFAQHYSKMKATERKEKRKELDRKIKMLHKKLACINLNLDKAVEIIEKFNKKLDLLKIENETHSNFSMQGAMLHSKTRYYELGEKS